MMGPVRSVVGAVKVKITAADIPRFLSAVNKAGIRLADVSCLDELTVQAEVTQKEYRLLCGLAERHGLEIVLLRRQGIHWQLLRLSRRYVLVAGVALVLALTCFLPSRVLFVRVEGNSQVSDERIMSAAENVGVYFGASRQVLRSEKVKNYLLAAIPQLQWAGVNTQGCVATISVREKPLVVSSPSVAGISSIVAARDGVISSCTATRGNALCSVGQAVKAGEVLISGYTDNGIRIQATRAEGEIYAMTQYTMTVRSPSQYIYKGACKAVKKKYGLIIGKKRINFFKCSGILDSSCDKMYVEYPLVLPGGFRLPVTLIEECWIDRQSFTGSSSEECVTVEMKDFAQEYLSSQMVGGKILSGHHTVDTDDDFYRLCGTYYCHEMIGRVQSEELMTSNGKGD